ncbi:unnamed protein product [Hyaloperonospora brassicae]|uniref:Uncharacterized protein n=1 Tax=Hyaloperonospora brassicae TaxID=162125 RepID=A0AAV0T7D4_HYABA|nr:unnamed protein product [Hyaloperonospora brassicae]
MPQHSIDSSVVHVECRTTTSAPRVRALTRLSDSYWSARHRPHAWRLRYCEAQDVGARADGPLAYTMDEAVDLEVLTYMASTRARDAGDCSDEDAAATCNGSGLPLVCSNCGVSFFSLQIPDDQMDCYCSGECKWSVIMYREMDRRLFARRNKCALDAIGRARPRAAVEAAAATDARRAGATSITCRAPPAACAVDTLQTGTDGRCGSGVLSI